MVDWPTVYLARARPRKSALRWTCTRATSVCATAWSAVRYCTVMSLRSCSAALVMSASVARRDAFCCPVADSSAPESCHAKDRE